MQALYLEKPYEKEFTSNVKSANGKFIVLEQTLFYPNSGGQPFDTGTLTDEEGNTYQVVFVGKFNGEISHEVDKEGLQAGQTVKGSIAWERRYILMRYHTASHVLSSLIHKETGAEITGNQLDTEKSRVDFSLESFDRDIMMGFEEKTNEILRKDIPVISKFLPREEAFQIPSLVKLRKAFDASIQTIRVLDIQGVDIQACGGTHVKNLKEIGQIKIIQLENKGKDRRRLYFVLI
ncbi:alanyl-tRNA editing protein [Candidatus Woesearchaeota archaeon]|nr:MAG: alanyl-tRNA editing protein [Candidatus Woesearchaeota archaeon]